MKIDQPVFAQKDHETWKQLFELQSPLRQQQIIPEFSKGLELLEISGRYIPELENVNNKLQALTGWRGVFVEGFKEASDFFMLLTEKKFPVGNFIRDAKDLSYTPAPDIFHDLYGHIPFFTIPEYASFCQEFSKRALKFSKSEKIIREFQRFFWFTIEFALVKTSAGRRVFGAGIASSFNECAYSLSEKPTIKPFDIETIRNREFRIDILQETLFELDNVDQLYYCLDDFEKPYLNEGQNVYDNTKS